MSSLRISDQSRATGNRGIGGEAARTDDAVRDASFTLALGAAGQAEKGPTAGPFGAMTSAPSNASATPSKRAESHGKAQDPAAVLAAQVTFSQPGTAGSAFGIPAADRGDAAPAGPFGAVTSDLSNGSATPRKGADRNGNADNAAGVLAAGVLAIGGTLSQGVISGGPPGISATFKRGDATVAAVTTAIDAFANPAGQSATSPISLAAGDDSAASALRLTPAVASTAQALAPDAIASLTPSDPLPTASASGMPSAIVGLTPSDPLLTASAMPSDYGLALTNVPSPAVAEALPTLLAALPQDMPAVARAQLASGEGDGGPARRDAGRARPAPIGALSGSGDATVALAPSGPGETSVIGSAPGTASVTATDASISDQLSTQLVRLVTNGSHEMVMRLHPPELGEVTLRVAVSGRDVSAWFGSPHPQVQAALTGALGQLQTDLGSAGYNLNGAWVGADASGARQHTPSPFPPSQAPIAPVNLDPPSLIASHSSVSAVNIYV